MTIREINDNTILQTFDACGHARSLNMDDIIVGIVIEGQVNAAVIPMLMCWPDAISAMGTRWCWATAGAPWLMHQER